MTTKTTTCACRIVSAPPWRLDSVPEITYCPLHAAAQEMAEVLKLLVEADNLYAKLSRSAHLNRILQATNKARAALAKAGAA